MEQSTISSLTPGKRLISLDAFRGLVMLSMLVHTFGLEKLSHYPIVGFIYTQLTHAPWRGFHFEDVILPWFLLIIGMSMAISERKRQEHGENDKQRFMHVLRRAVLLFVIGFILTWIEHEKPYFGAGVLQVLALSYFFAYLFLARSIQYQFCIIAVLLFIYWFFIYIVPVPGVGRDSYIIYRNLVYYIDDIITGSATRWGYLYTLINSAAVVVYGSIIGKLLMNRTSHKQFIKTLALLGVIGILGGIVSQPFIPIIKRMFTSSYTLFTCGIVSLLYMAFYWIIEVKGYNKWSFIFIVFGMNSIFVYTLNGLLKTWLLETGGILVDPVSFVIGDWVSPLNHFLALLTEWLVCLWLYRRKIFFKL